MLLVHASPTTLARHRRPNLGVLSSPRRVYLNVDGWRWAADNDAYSQWDVDRYRAMLETIRTLDGCLFVTAPDVVGDWAATREFYDEWRPELDGLPVAYVAQDGQPLDEVPWDSIGALFLGGTSQYKLGAGAARLAREALARGLWLHMGRVNSRRRLFYAAALGCDSVDGTSFSWYRDTWLDEFLAYASAPRQMLLEEGA